MAAEETSTDDYVLSRHYKASTRLNLQHFLWAETFEYLLHPTIKFSHYHPLKIADVGSGTCQWLFDLSRAVPRDYELHSFDIDFGQAPPAAWCPQNILRRQWDVTQDVPPDLVGYFDIVNIRYFVFIVKDDDPRPLLRNLVKLLKPGGFLQWGEPDCETFRTRELDTAKSHQAMERLYKESVALDGRFQPTWVRKLPEIFKKEGLKHVLEDRRVGTKHNCYFASQANFMVIDEVLEHPSFPKEKVAGLRCLLLKASQESGTGVMIIMDRVHVVGIKPVD